MKESSDDVTRIHRRYSLTLINPASYRQSLAISLVIATILATVTSVFYLNEDNSITRLLSVLTVLVVTQFIDSRFIKRKEYSKSLHMSSFGNILWLLVVLSGMGAGFILSKDPIQIFYVVEGMFIFASFRIGLFTTVLGTSISKAWLLCFLQPLSMFLVMVPFDMWYPSFTSPTTLLFGAVFLGMATVWSFMTDRAGRPGVQSTHKLVQAYIASRGKDFTEIETMIEERAKPQTITTSQILLESEDKKNNCSIVLPEIHPGPYHPIGGSNIPYLIYKRFSSSAMVMHSISDHSLNLPSRDQVELYLSNLKDNQILNQGMHCAEPTVVQVNKARVTGLLFDKNIVMFLSLSPHGMEDLPSYFKSEIEQYAKNRNYDRVLLVDCHNAMGKEISKEDSDDMLNAAKSCMDNLITKETHPLEYGYANSDSLHIKAKDLGMGGVGVLCLRINNKKYFLGWADANNMENGLREQIVSYFQKSGLDLLEICTSDTHFSQSVVRNKQGYFQFGKISDPKQITNWYYEVAKKAEANLKPTKFSLISNETKVKVMGPQIFADYLKALDNSLRLTKGFGIAGIAMFLVSLIL